MGDELFSTPILSFHLQTSWIKGRKTLTDGGKAPFHHSLGFCLLKHITDPFKHQNDGEYMDLGFQDYLIEHRI